MAYTASWKNPTIQQTISYNKYFQIPVSNKMPNLFNNCQGKIINGSFVWKKSVINILLGDFSKRMSVCLHPTVWKRGTWVNNMWKKKFVEHLLRLIITVILRSPIRYLPFSPFVTKQRFSAVPSVAYNEFPEKPTSTGGLRPVFLWFLTGLIKNI